MTAAPENAPALCPVCMSRNVVAPAGGPTCAHNRPPGASWWPQDWPTMPEHERLAWLAERQKHS